MVVTVFCACGHEWSLHDLVPDQFGIELRKGPCHAGCPCPRFTPVALPSGTYVPKDGANYEGFEIVRHDPKGIERACVMCNDRMTEYDARYIVKLFPSKESDPLDAVYRDNADWATDLEGNYPLAFISSVACEDCVLNAAGQAA